MAHRQPDQKMHLNNYCQGAGRRYQFVTTPHGPRHAPTWSSIVYVDEQQFGTGQGPSAIAAENMAAAQALNLINQGY
ncbi:hypothetical protein VNI00_015983 [Paramarasmius palmivorus]|uniref:DRBM domain-containing protein n=1 Tax=Paramarasmius palmivorus TaxID=297713 RepID=A0AAW0BHY6_9AGAR